MVIGGGQWERLEVRGEEYCNSCVGRSIVVVISVLSYSRVCGDIALCITVHVVSANGIASSDHCVVRWYNQKEAMSTFMSWGCLLMGGQRDVGVDLIDLRLMMANIWRRGSCEGMKY